MDRADRLASRLFRRASCAIRQTEAFLEDALAAALEHPDVWPRLRGLAHWEALPAGPPRVDTQETVELGRTDIILRWAAGPGFVLELKAWDPLPTSNKLHDYRARGDLVTVIAPHPAVYPSPFLPMLTWARLRGMHWPAAPLPWRQLCHLIDTTGVAVPRLDMPAMIGLVPTWTAYDLMEGWIRPAADAVAAALSDGTTVWVTREGKQRQRLRWDHRRYGMWIWPSDANDENLAVFCGVYVGTERRAVLVPGVPDLRLMLNVKHDGAVAENLRRDTRFTQAAEEWAVSVAGLARQYDPEWWYLLDARESLVSLAPAEDQALAFREWMAARAREWADRGLTAAAVRES